MALFGKKDKVAIDLQSISTLISEGCVVDGNLKAPAYVRIDGQVNGDVFIEEGLIIGEKGVVFGNVLTKELVVYGTLNGNLQAGSLEIKSTGKINGEIQTLTLSVESGAVYNGNLSMTPSEKSPDIAQIDNPEQKAIEA